MTEENSLLQEVGAALRDHGITAAITRPDLPAFERSGARKRRSGPKTLDRQANLGDLGVKWHATWGMSVKIHQ